MITREKKRKKIHFSRFHDEFWFLYPVLAFRPRATIACGWLKWHFEISWA